MRLVEVVKCAKTSMVAAEAAIAVTKRMGKIGVLVRNTNASHLFIFHVL
jgi:3-hydroxyacyl-CoA dehydrogenase